MGDVDRIYLILVSIAVILGLAVLVLAVCVSNLHNRLKAYETAKREKPDPLPWTDKCMAVGHSQPARRPH